MIICAFTRIGRWKQIFIISLLLGILIPLFSDSERPGLLSITPTQITFSHQIITTSSDSVSVTVTNVGDAAIQIMSVNLGGTSPGGSILHDENRYPLILAADSTMYFSVSFLPLMAIEYQAVVQITDELTPLPHTIALSGTGSNPSILNFPYTEGFENTLFPPNNWTAISSANSSFGWRRSNIVWNAHSGSAYAVVGLSNADYWLISPSFEVAPEFNTIRFWMKNNNDIPDSDISSTSEYLDVLISTSSSDTTGFHTTLLHYTNEFIPENWQEYLCDLSNYNGSVVYLAFKRHSTNGKYINLDDFSISTAPTTLYNPPTYLNASVIANEVNLTWQEPVHQANEHLSGYKVFRNNTLLQTLQSTLPASYSDTNVPIGFYTYQVKAVYGSNISEFSSSYNVDMTWGYPNLIYYDSFDSYSDFSTAFGFWDTLDDDESSTFNFDEVAYPNMTIPKSFMIFNPTVTNPPMTYLLAHSGNKMLACFDDSNPPNSDWLITPEIQLGFNSSISFWAKSYTAYYGLERFNLMLSTTNPNPHNFISLTGADTVNVPAVQWTQYNYNLSAYDFTLVYLAIQCVSDYAVALLIDDFKIISTGGHVGNDDHLAIANHSILLGNYPNPFNPETSIRFNLIHKENVRIEIYNIRGQRIRTLMDEERSQGTQSVLWNGKDDSGHPVASGVYFYQMKAGSYTQTKKMILLK